MGRTIEAAMEVDLSGRAFGDAINLLDAIGGGGLAKSTRGFGSANRLFEDIELFREAWER